MSEEAEEPETSVVGGAPIGVRLVVDLNADVAIAMCECRTGRYRLGFEVCH